MNILLTFFLSFLLCGFISMIAQVILDNTSLTTGHITSLFVVIGVILEFLGVYQYIKDFSLIGASMPIVSFGSVIMKSVKQAIDNDGVIGIFKGVFLQCGTIISFSIFLSFISTIFFKPKS